jgi:hypothetical protein
MAHDFDRWGNKTRLFMKANLAVGATDWDDVVIPNGETWVVRGADSATPYQGCNAAVVWDRGGTPELLYLGYGTVSMPIERELTGDGTKKLSIRLKNNSSLSADMMCRYHAEKL